VGWRVVPAVEEPRADLPRLALEYAAACALWAQGASLGALAPDGALTSALDPADLPEPPTARRTRS
jgi:hypothetical protein